VNKIINFENINIQYVDYQVLMNINFVLREGEMLYLVGRSGEGKTSLIKAIVGDLKLSGQSASVLGCNLLNISKNQLPAFRKRIGIVSQDLGLLHDRSVFDNLDFVLRATGWKSSNERLLRVNEVLELVGLSSKRDQMPHRLSGGQRQKLAISRALLNKPELVIADEPTGQLDPESSEEIVALLANINHLGTSLIISTHDLMSIDMHPARVVRCSEGKLIDLGGILFDLNNS